MLNKSYGSNCELWTVVFKSASSLSLVDASCFCDVLAHGDLNNS